MKRHILLIQSLLLLPLISTPSLFSMEPQDGNLTPQKYTSGDNLGEKYDSAAEGDLAESTGSLAVSMAALFEDAQPLLSVSTMNREKNEINQEIDLLEAELTAFAEQSAAAKETVQPADVIQMANLKQDMFEELHNQLLKDPVALKKTPEATHTTTPVEDWVEKYEQCAAKQQNLLDTIASNKIILKNNLKPTLLEQQEKLITITKLLTNGPKVELKTPKNYPTASALLTESIMITPTPAKTGLADLPYSYQAGYACGTHKAHHIIEYLFTDMGTDNTEAKKIKFNVDGIAPDNTKTVHYLFDIKNETHIELLEQTFNYYISQNDDQALMNLLEKCQCTAGELQINPRVAGKIHNYLAGIIKNEEADSQLILKNKNDAFIQKSNALVLALQEELVKRTKEMHEEFDKYNKECDDTFAKKTAYIRQLEENAIAAHILSPDLKPSKKECSHAIDSLRSHATKAKVYMTQQDVKAVCSNDRLLKKIELSEPMAALKKDSLFLLAHVSAINSATHGVTLLK